MSRFSQSVVEDAAPDWLKSPGWTIKHGPQIAPGEPKSGAHAPR